MRDCTSSLEGAVSVFLEVTSSKVGITASSAIRSLSVDSESSAAAAGSGVEPAIASAVAVSASLITCARDSSSGMSVGVGVDAGVVSFSSMAVAFSDARTPMGRALIIRMQAKRRNRLWLNSFRFSTSCLVG